MTFTWRCDPPVDLTALSDPPTNDVAMTSSALGSAATGAAESADPAETGVASFGNQSDAESWLGLVWRELAERGVATVTLYEDDTVCYQMPLDPA